MTTQSGGSAGASKANGTSPAADSNSVRQTSRRASEREKEAAPERPSPRAAAERSAPAENSIRAAKRKARNAPPRAPSSTSKAGAIPEEVRRQFVQVGRKYYFPDGARAFTDRGRKLTTPSENTEVIRSLITIAQARGWSDIHVTGTKRFKKEAWLAAKVAGMEVRGYNPSEFEKEHLVRTLARVGAKQSAASPTEPSRRAESESRAKPREESTRAAGAPREARERRGALLTGRLVDHDVATYRHDPREPVSYFVKIETEGGEREIWGVDLQRALKESLSGAKIGDEIGLRAVRQDAVTVKSAERDAAGNVIGEKEFGTHRNRWIVEKRDFFKTRAEAARTLRDSKIEPQTAVKQHPELTGTYLYLRSAEEIAERRIRDPADRRKFVATVRQALADSVARGEPLPPVRLRERSAAERPASRSPREADREQAPVRG